MENCPIFVTANLKNETMSIPIRNKEIRSAEYNALFQRAYSDNLQKVIFFAQSYVNDMSEAQNIAQDVFANFWKNIENVNRETYPSYLFASTKNLCLNHLRKKKNATKYNGITIAEKTADLNRIALEGDNSIKAFESEVQEIINSGLCKMKPKVRRTFMMSRIKGLKNREISEIEGISESTVEARISSALLLMRKMLEDYIK